MSYSNSASPTVLRDHWSAEVRQHDDHTLNNYSQLPMSNNKKRYKLEVTRTYQIDIEIDYDVFSKKNIEDYESWIGPLTDPRDLISNIDHIHREFGRKMSIEGIGQIPVREYNSIDAMLNEDSNRMHWENEEDVASHGIRAYIDSDRASVDTEIEAVSDEGYETEIDIWPWEED